LPEKKSHDINKNCQITLEVLYDQITYHVYNNLAYKLATNNYACKIQNVCR